MKDEKVEGYLAHISDTVTELATHIAESREVQQNILSTMQIMLDALEAQSEMLGEILGAAAQETGPSPVAEALNALCGLVQQMDQSQAALITHVVDLPAAIGRHFEACLKASPPAAQG